MGRKPKTTQQKKVTAIKKKKSDDFIDLYVDTASTPQEKLDAFRADNGGKLPSLRHTMKLLNVGYPKAQEILNEYAKHLGCTKDMLLQKMTVRQNPKRKKTRKSV